MRTFTALDMDTLFTVIWWCCCCYFLCKDTSLFHEYSQYSQLHNLRKLLRSVSPAGLNGLVSVKLYMLLK